MTRHVPPVRASALGTVLLCLLAALLPSCLTVSADDGTDLRVLVEKFFALYQKKDLDGFMALWSEKSPEYASRKQAMRQQFAANDFTFENLAITRVKVDARKASLRAAIDSTTINVRNPQSRKERMIRHFAFVKEGEAWGVWRYAPAADDLAAAFVVVTNGSAT